MDTNRNNIAIIVVIVVVFLAVLFGWNNVRTNNARPTPQLEFSFNPKQCKDKNDSNIYIAIDRVVFKLPINEDFYMHSLEPLTNFDVTKSPVPPDPKEWQGCLDHPIQVRKFHSEKIGTVFRITEYTNLNDYEKKFADLLAHKFAGDSVCAQDITDKEYVICNLISIAPRREVLRTMYKADEKIYSAPDGKPFFIYCDYIPANNCNITYSIAPGIRLKYQFSKSSRLISDVISVDIARRKYFGESILNNYKWARLK